MWTAHSASIAGAPSFSWTCKGVPGERGSATCYGTPHLFPALSSELHHASSCSGQRRGARGRYEWDWAPPDGRRHFTLEIRHESTRGLDGGAKGKTRGRAWRSSGLRRSHAMALAMAGSAAAGPAFSPGWFADKRAPSAQAAATGRLPGGGIAGIPNAQREQQRSQNEQLQRSLVNLNRTAAMIAAQQSAQAAARARPRSTVRRRCLTEWRKAD